MADGGVKGKDETPIGIDQRMANQKDPLQIIAEVMLSKMIERNKDTSDVNKRSISKRTVWQKTFICIKRKE